MGVCQKWREGEREGERRISLPGREREKERGRESVMMREINEEKEREK